MGYRLKDFTYTGSTAPESKLLGVSGGSLSFTETRLVQSSTISQDGLARAYMLAEHPTLSDYVCTSTTIRQADRNAYEIDVNYQHKHAAGFRWQLEFRSSLQSYTTMRDNTGSLILSYYGENTPRVHAVDATRASHEILLRRLCTVDQAVEISALVGRVNSDVVTLKNFVGSSAEYGYNPGTLLCASVRFDLTYVQLGVGYIEIYFLITQGGLFPPGMGSWDAVVIWADENGVTPPDAQPSWYAIPPRATYSSVDALFEEEEDT